jgi:hypothetical protein
MADLIPAGRNMTFDLPPGAVMDISGSGIFQLVPTQPSARGSAASTIQSPKSTIGPFDALTRVFIQAGADPAYYSISGGGIRETQSAELRLSPDPAVNSAIIQGAAAQGGIYTISRPGDYPVTADNFVLSTDSVFFIGPGVFFTVNGIRQPLRSIGSFVSRPVVNPQPYAFTGQIPWASFGDSFSNMCSLPGQDIRQGTAALSFTVERMAPWLNGFSNGICRPVANCGISGETTTQMLARDSAGPSATRKAIADAAALGARFIHNHWAVNDCQSLAGGASDSSIQTVVTTAVNNSVALLKRQIAFGIYPITYSLMGYNLNTATSPEILTRRVAINRYNETMSQIVRSAGGLLGSWVDAFSLVASADGNWLPGMDDGLGLHPGSNACRTVYPLGVAEMLRLSGMSTPPMLGYGLFTNLVTNGDFSASSSGIATNFAMSVGAGTGTFTHSIVDFAGQNWQQSIFTPATFDAATVLLNDVIGGELSLIIDSPSGGAPTGLFAYLARLRANTAFSEVPFINPTISPKVSVSAPIDMRMAFPPIVSPAATPATFHIIVQVATTSTAPVRVRLSRPRAFKLPTTY